MPISDGEDDRGPGALEAQERHVPGDVLAEAQGRGAPKYSPMTAPIVARVVATRRAVKTNGSAVGMRTARRTWTLAGGVRAHQLERAG